MEELLIPTHLTELDAEYELYCGVTKIDKVAYFFSLMDGIPQVNYFFTMRKI